MLFVRNGQQLLGKLPVVPGDQTLWVAPLRNDDLRLEAEGFLLGVQDSLVDLVARREVLAVRIRRAIADGELDKADELLRELRRLDTQDDFARRVQQRKQTLSSADAQVQQKIDELFAQTRTLMGKYLNQEQVDELSRALDEARRSPRSQDASARRNRARRMCTVAACSPAPWCDRAVNEQALWVTVDRGRAMDDVDAIQLDIRNPCRDRRSFFLRSSRQQFGPGRSPRNCW